MESSPDKSPFPKGSELATSCNVIVFAFAATLAVSASVWSKTNLINTVKLSFENEFILNNDASVNVNDEILFAKPYLSLLIGLILSCYLYAIQIPLGQYIYIYLK